METDARAVLIHRLGNSFWRKLAIEACPLSPPEADAGKVGTSAQLQSDLSLLCERKSVFYIDAKIPHGVFDLAMT